LRRTFYILSFILLTGTTTAWGQTRTTDPPGKILKFFPNPATTVITFNLQKTNDKNFSLQVFNFLGKKVFESNNIAANTVVNVSEFYRGIYVFQLRDANGKVIDSGKFQVTK
jgi:Secretion system C-terminal sorting domain